MIEVDVQKVLHNIDTARGMIGPKVKLCAVVKGDAYGCGDVRFSKALQRSGKVDMLAVAMLDEAIHLRDSGVQMPILVLGDIKDEDAALVLKYTVIPSIYRLDFARKLSNLASTPVPVHVRVDVCQGSPGIEPAKVPQTIEKLLHLPGVRLEGVYTQLYGAYTNDAAALDNQLSRFRAVVDALDPGLRSRLLIHAASTPAFCKRADSYFDMVRMGAALYGLPFEEGEQLFEPVLTIRSHIISLKKVRGAAFAGYNALIDGNGERVLATIMGGYEDALFLMFVQNGFVLVNGQKAPIVGEACMDTTTIDVSHIDNVRLGDPVMLLGSQGNERITIQDIMSESGFTMANCQLVYKTGRRTPRRFVNDPTLEGWRGLLQQVRENSPTVDGALRLYEENTLDEYVEAMAEFVPAASLQDSGDATEAVEAELRAFLSEEEARRCAALAKDCLLTANHHGVDCFPQSMQGNLLFARLLEKRGLTADSVPVIACGGIPMDNSSYGKGLMVFDTLNGSYPMRLPILPNRHNDAIVGLYPAFGRDMVEKALGALEEPKWRTGVSDRMRWTIRRVLLEGYLSPESLKNGDYLSQAAWVNHHFSKEALGKGFAYVSLEKVATRLLLKDIQKKDSLAHALLFDKNVRREALTSLDGCAGCWGASGTVFFWEVRDGFERGPLVLEDDALVSKKTGARCPMNEEAISEALKNGKIFPGLLLCFLPLVFARGLRAFGGCFQPAYLADMRKGLALALENGDRKGLAYAVRQVRCDGYLSGPMFLSTQGKPPKGLLELVNEGENKKLTEICTNLNFLQAHRLALANLYPDTVPAALRPKEWKSLL